ncbi:MAG: alcohol acetyltransferase [Nostoc sp. NMS1]|uniref:phthiocerol/phthiodiolone dimycocerosyl transferase family protein n=1 Tax=unclassified Nostoc TaxID=2593658 RepID=UPI0025F3A102|nr:MULTISPECIES: condensation domain-containing protein [unclassified Nostoc]MBN3905279.1 alcohol acetyltransferase [Nostoc sp. NMS1]MBN3994822.1 alcohol acetyltransferase [Nostoc sp. NMS2]
MIYNRKLGCLEQAMEILNSHAKTWNIVTISRIKGYICEETLAQALDVIQCLHPRLNSQIIRSKNSFSFQNQGTAKITLRVVRQSNNEQWQEVVYEEMNKGIDSSQGLLRVVLVHLVGDEHISYLITTIHHAIADGLSSIRLHSEILTFCQKIVSGEPIHPLTSLTPLPPIEELMPEWTKGFTGKINSIIFLLQLGFQKVWNQPKTLGFHKYVSVAKRNCNIIHRQLNQDLTQKFVNHCRQENTTIHSALCAVLMFTVVRKRIKGNRKNVRVNCLSYFDLRRYLEPAISDNHMAVLASSIMGFHTIRRNMSIWELAREVKQKLEFSKKSGDLFKMILIAKHLIDFCFIFPKQVAATVSVSNVGKVNVPAIYGEFELEEISFAGSHALYAGVFVIHASTFKGKMLLNFVFSQPSIDQNDMEIIVNNIMSYIFDICNLNRDCLLTFD